MDGLDLSAIDKLDEEIFNRSSSADSADEDCDLPMPDCIGIDSALQDGEQERREREEAAKATPKPKTKAEEERELELRVLKPGSIRQQMLARSLSMATTSNQPTTSKSASNEPPPGPSKPTAPQQAQTLMNIREKAGMGGIDKERINEIIHEASKGSLFYKKQAQRQEEIHRSIEKMLTKVKNATPQQVESARMTCDRLHKELEKQRSFNRVIVHFDLDMFFAAVEILDNPGLANKPVAVGGDSMVSTSNYVARRFGVRAAMPGFIARKLCPDLILIKPNGSKYRKASSEVFSILEKYDPELTGMSLDEAYLDLTEYVKSSLEESEEGDIEEYYDGTLPKIWWERTNDVVQEIRRAIFEKTRLTCSAGIACNTLLAKISTDINKPDGQFMVQGYPRDVTDFISKTPVGKVSGIGKVSEQFLNALNIKTCGDIYEKRHFLPLVFYEINVRFYLRVAMGDGSTSLQSDEQRKSKSVERTFAAVKETNIMLDKLESICEELCVKYLKPYRIRGRTVTVKLKRNTFTTTTRSYSMLVPTNDQLVIYSAAKNLLATEMANEPPEISYRLLGVRLSNLADDTVATNQLTIDAMLRNSELGKPAQSGSDVYQVTADPKVAQLEPSSDNSESQHSNPLISSDRGGADETDKVIDLENIDEEAPQRGVKRKQSRKIEDFFSPKLFKNEEGLKSEVEGAELSSPKIDEPVAEDGELTTFSSERSDTGPNSLSQTEQQQNHPNDDDFQCPYCFKPFSDFSLLEKHVDECNLKTSIDVLRPFCNRNKSESPLPSKISTQGRTETGRASKTKSDKRQLKIKQEPIRVQTQPNVSFNSPSGTQKISFYQKFLESNTQSLSQSPKIEPLQCPYCLHGYLNFDTLQNHVVMCTKNKRR